MPFSNPRANDPLRKEMPDNRPSRLAFIHQEPDLLRLLQGQNLEALVHWHSGLQAYPFELVDKFDASAVARQLDAGDIPRRHGALSE